MPKTKKPAKPKPEKVDGFGPKERSKVHAAIRRVWQQSSHARKLCQKRVALPGDYHRCEDCGLQVPKVYIDHIEPVGNLADGDAIARLFCPSTNLQALCKTCHDAKTALEKKAKKAMS